MQSRILVGVILFIVGGILWAHGGVCAADSRQLIAAFETIRDAQLDTATTLDLNGYTLTHKDLRVTFSTGRIAFFKPLVLDNDSVVFGAYFEGSGLFQFTPGTPLERDQLFRYFHADSLNRKFSSLILLFSPEVHQSLKAAGMVSTQPFSSVQLQAASRMISGIGSNEQRQYVFETLRNLATPIGGPFLMVDLQPELTDRLYYLFDPYEREEIRLLRQGLQAELDRIDLVSSYSQYLDTSCRVINGLSKEQIVVTHYTVDASLDKKGIFRGRTDVTFNVERGPLQMVPMVLKEEMQIDSVKDASGKIVSFLRYRSTENKSSSLELFFDRPLAYQDTVTLQFFYRGPLALSGLAEVYVNTAGDWYPRCRGYRQRAVFDMTFRTPSKFTFAVSGNQLVDQSTGDTLLTTWRVIPPAVDVCITMGLLHGYRYENEDMPPLDIYFSQSLHEALAASAGHTTVLSDSLLYDQVAGDMLNSLKLFSHYFGPYPYQQVSVDEARLRAHDASPSFAHLPFDTWTDFKGYPDERVVRFDEAARQWWGVGVGYESYHDEWLSDGFSAYCALLYLQAAGGNDLFIDKIRQYRNDIFTARNYVPGSGEESGPIALGYRTMNVSSDSGGSPIIYKKGALVLHMLRNLLIDFKTMKEDSFFGMMSEFYQANRGKDVTTADFQRLTEKYTGVKMDWFFREFVYGEKLPTYDFTYDYEQDSLGNYVAHGRLVTQGVDEGFRMFVPLEIQIDDVNRAYVRLFVDTTDFVFTLPSLPRKPVKLVLNPFESVLATVRQP